MLVNPGLTYNPHGVIPSGIEKVMSNDTFIVSKTNMKGIITDANPVFIKYSGYKYSEIIGSNHNLIRHPDMPKCAFFLLWTILKFGLNNNMGLKVFVLNMSKTGDHYWVHASITPDFDFKTKKPFGYHSERRAPNRKILDDLLSTYNALKKAEFDSSGNNPFNGMFNGANTLASVLGLEESINFLEILEITSKGLKLKENFSEVEFQKLNAFIEVYKKFVYNLQKS